MVIVRPTVRREPIYSPRRWVCIARRLFNSNNLFSSAALAEVCALLSVILVYSVVLCLPFPVWFAYINNSLQCCCSFPIFLHSYAVRVLMSVEQARVKFSRILPDPGSGTSVLESGKSVWGSGT